MTRKELVEQLTANFAEDEEVFVKYDDDQGVCVDPIKGIEEVSEDYCKTHYEVEKDGKWVMWDKKGHPTHYGVPYAKSRIVVDRKWTETKRCIIVS